MLENYNWIDVNLRIDLIFKDLRQFFNIKCLNYFYNEKFKNFFD